MFRFVGSTKIRIPCSDPLPVVVEVVWASALYYESRLDTTTRKETQGMDGVRRFIARETLLSFAKNNLIYE